MSNAIASEAVVLVEPVRVELLIGARSNVELRLLRRMLESFEIELLHPRDDFEAACTLFHRCRASGVTPRGLIDCVIAAVALRRELPLLHNDRDLAFIASVVGIEQVSL